MSAHPPNVYLSDPVMEALREIAEKHHKTVDQMANEMVITGISASNDRKIVLLGLMEFGRAKAEENGLADADDAELVHKWRKENPPDGR